MPRLLPPWLLAGLLLAASPRVGRAGKAPVETFALAPAAAPPSGPAAAAAAKPQESIVAAEPAPGGGDPDLKLTAEQEVEKQKEHLKQLATEKTAESIKTINSQTEKAKSDVKSLIDHEANHTRTEQAKEMDEIIHKQSDEMKANREKIAQEAQETLSEVKDSAEIAATESAKNAVDDVAETAKLEIDAVEAQADIIKKEANKLAAKAVKAAEVSMAAARNASEWARKLPAKEAAKAVKIAKDAQAISVALQNQARYVKRVAKLASGVADSSIVTSKKATDTAEMAKSVAEEAVEQAGQNAKLLKSIKATTVLANKNAYDASMKSMQAVYAAQAATKEAKEVLAKKAAEDLEKAANAPAETTGLLTEATVLRKRMLKKALGPAPAPAKLLAATVLRSRVMVNAAKPNSMVTAFNVPQHEDGVSGTADWGMEYGPPSQPKRKASMNASPRAATAAVGAAGFVAALFAAV